MQGIVGLFVPILKELHEMNYLHHTPIVLDDTKLMTLLPNTKKTSYAEGVKIAVAAAQKAP